MASLPRDPMPGRVLRLARHMMGMSQRGFAARVKMKTKTLGKVEAGSRPAHGFVLESAAHAAGLPPQALVILADVARGQVTLSPEQRAWLAERMLDAVLRGLKDGAAL